MENEQIEQTHEIQQEVVENETQKYLDVINDLKRNSISKDKYDKIVEENRNLLNSIVNGETERRLQEQPIRSDEELVSIMLNKDVKPIDFMEAALEFRTNVYNRTGKDVFVGSGHTINPNSNYYAIAEGCAKVYRDCLDLSSGNDTKFIQELQNRIKDVRLPGMKY